MKNDIKIELAKKVVDFVDTLESKLTDKDKRKVCSTAYKIFNDKVHNSKK